MVGEDESNIVHLFHHQYSGDFRSGEVMVMIISRGKSPATVIASHTITINEKVYWLKGVAYYNAKSQHYTCDVELGGIWWDVCHPVHIFSAQLLVLHELVGGRNGSRMFNSSHMRHSTSASTPLLSCHQYGCHYPQQISATGDQHAG